MITSEEQGVSGGRGVGFSGGSGAGGGGKEGRGGSVVAGGWLLLQ